MTEPPAPLPPPNLAPAPAPLHCPRCQSPVAPEQDWCLTCGAPARTRLAPTPNWRLPIVAVLVTALLAGLVLALSFVKLTDGQTPVAAPATTVATTAPPAPATTLAPAPVDPNATATDTTPTLPPATETTPAATATAPADTTTATTPTTATSTTQTSTTQTSTTQTATTP